MTLQNYLYTIERREDNTFSVKLIPDCEIFKAHFEGHPVLPGVCITRMITELSEILVAKRLSLYSIVNLKFLEVVSPEKTEEVCFVFDNVQHDNDNVKIKGKVMAGEHVFTKFSILYNIINQ